MRKSGRAKGLPGQSSPPGFAAVWFAVVLARGDKKEHRPAGVPTLAIFADCAACTLYLLLGGYAGLGNGRGSLAARRRLAAVLAAAPAGITTAKGSISCSGNDDFNGKRKSAAAR